MRCLHGFGDSVQFLRYLPQLQSQASKVYVEVDPRFADLARYLMGVDEVITWGSKAPQIPPEWDVQMEVMELPYVFRTQVGQLPLAQRYLQIKAPAGGASTRPQIALSWTAGEWNPTRAIPLPLLTPILEEQGCDFWNLTTHCAPRVGSASMHEDDLCRSTVVGLAQRIAAADLVITVDTLAAHIAGAMGVPVWLMLQHRADWRWMRDREDSPWYPSTCIFRQSNEGDWQGVVRQVMKKLRSFVDLHRSRRASATKDLQDKTPTPAAVVGLQ